MSISVYVVVAMDEDCRVRECFVRSDMNEAWTLYKTLGSLYGGANVCMANRLLDDAIPARIVRQAVDTQLEGILQGIEAAQGGQAQSGKGE